MSDAAFADFERQVEFLPIFQLRHLRNKIDSLLSRQAKSDSAQKTRPTLSPITSRLFGVAKFDYVNAKIPVKTASDFLEEYEKENSEKIEDEKREE